MRAISFCLSDPLRRLVNFEAREGKVWVVFVVPPSKQVFNRALRIGEHGEAEWELMCLSHSSHFRETGREETP